MKSSEVIPSFVEEVEIRLIRQSARPLRGQLGSLDGLMVSISEKGLLQPILLRPLDDGFEVIAGHRRLEACKRLRAKRVMCHIVNMDDKEAYEASIIENLQHRSLDPLEEARAFKKYVDDYGYGAESELSKKIGKSQQFISQRMHLLDLPDEVLEKVSSRLVTLSHAAELMGLSADDQLLVSDEITRGNLSTRDVRKLATALKQSDSSKPDPDSNWKSSAATDDTKIDKALSKCIASLRSNMIRIDDTVAHLDEKDWVVVESLMLVRKQIHEQIDGLLRLQRRTKKLEPKYWVI